MLSQTAWMAVRQCVLRESVDNSWDSSDEAALPERKLKSWKMENIRKCKTGKNIIHVYIYKYLYK